MMKFNTLALVAVLSGTTVNAFSVSSPIRNSRAFAHGSPLSMSTSADDEVAALRAAAQKFKEEAMKLEKVRNHDLFKNGTGMERNYPVCCLSSSNE